MSSQVYIAEAYYSEQAKDRDGWKGTAKAGDQLQTVKEQATDYAGECRVSKYRNFATMVIRYKDREKAKKHVEACLFFVNSKLVGYDQPNRATLRAAIKELGFSNYKKLKKKSECDCSSLQALCANIAGVDAVKDWSTAEMLKQFPKLKEHFEILTDSKYLTSSDYLMEGDMLLKSGHIAVVVNNGAKVTAVSKKEEVKPSSTKTETTKIKTLQSAKSKDAKISGTYVTTADVNLRYGPNSTKFDSIKVLKKGTIVSCYGYYTDDWYYVQLKDSKTVGFIKSTYLSKKK